MSFKEHAQKAMEADERFQVLIASAPKEKACDDHPDIMLALSPEATWEKWAYANEWGKTYCKAEYQGCPKCKEVKARQRLTKAGVPDVLLDCTMDNWKPGSDEERGHLESVRTFATDIRQGFLVLVGPVGVGKSHLAVAVQRTFKASVFVKQSSLLRQLRATYSDKKAADPIERCQGADLLVLDEMGVSGGGKDEGPMLSEILDHRYGHLLPTIITSTM